MSITTYSDASEFLGNETDRYFTNGYRHFRWHVTAFECGENQLSGEMDIEYTGLAHPLGTAHIGSIEYTAMASMLAEYVLVYLIKLDAEQLSLSLLRQIRFKLRKSLELADRLSLPFRCVSGEPEWTLNATNGIMTPIAILLGDVEVSLVADHPACRWGRFDPVAVWPLNHMAMYNHGYKLRTNTITGVRCDTDNRVCTARVTREDRYVGNRHGLFSARHTIIPTDVLSVTGQLMQILLYTLENTSREACANIWLRAMDIRYSRAIWGDRYNARVRFLDFRTVSMGGCPWRVVELESQLNTIQGKFSIAHRLKPNPCV